MPLKIMCMNIWYFLCASFTQHTFLGDAGTRCLYIVIISIPQSSTSISSADAESASSAEVSDGQELEAALEWQPAGTAEGML